MKRKAPGSGLKGRTLFGLVTATLIAVAVTSVLPQQAEALPICSVIKKEWHYRDAHPADPDQSPDICEYVTKICCYIGTGGCTSSTSVNEASCQKVPDGFWTW